MLGLKSLLQPTQQTLLNDPPILMGGGQQMLSSVDGVPSYGVGRFLSGGLPTAPPSPAETFIEVPGHWTGSPKTIARDGFTYTRPEQDPGGTDTVHYYYGSAPETQQGFAYQPNYSMFWDPMAMLQAGNPMFGSPWYSRMPVQSPPSIAPQVEPPAQFAAGHGVPRFRRLDPLTLLSGVYDY